MNSTIWWEAGIALLAFGCGYAASIVQYLSANYSQSWIFIYPTATAVHLYGFCYGFLSLILFYLAPQVVTFQLGSLGQFAGRPVWAVASGLFIRNFMDVTLFTFTLPQGKMPLGLKTLVQVFEPPLTRQMVYAEYSSVRTFVAPFAGKFQSTAEILPLLQNSLPDLLPPQDVVAMVEEVKAQSSTTTALIKVLRRTGKSFFEKILGAPSKNPVPAGDPAHG